MKKKKICISIIDSVHYKFFKCFFNAIKNNGYEVMIVCNNIPIYIKSKLDNMHTIPLLQQKKIDNSHFKKVCKKVDFNTLAEILENTHDIKYAKKLYYGVYQLLHSDVFQEVEYFFMFNGEGTIDKSIAYFCSINKIKTIFFEISNLPNKIFIDHKGVNAKSYFFCNYRSILDKYPIVTDDLFVNWISDYEKYKQNKIPQANFKLNYKYLIIVILNSFNFFFNFLYSRPNLVKNIISDLKEYFKAKKNSCFINNIFLKNDAYIFSPLQVTTDSQIVINSNMNNIDLINYAKKIAKKNDLPLYVKIHPAEKDTRFIKYIISRHSKDFIIVTNNTTNLIKNAKKIISINSTICLEAMFYKKNIEIIGKSIYKNFSYEDAKKYVMHHLFDMCYFNPKELSTNDFKTLLEKYTQQTEI